MADDVTLNSGTGGDTIAADDISGVKHQRVKIQYGADGSATDVSDTNPLPIDDAGGSLTVDNADITTIAGAVSGTEMQVDIVSGNVTNAGTFVVQEDGASLTALQLIDDIVFTDDGDWTATTSKHALIGGIYQSSPGSITDGDTGPIRLDANGAVHINDGGNTITVDGTVTANPASGTIDTVTAVTDITNTIDSTISGAALTALQLIDDVVQTDDAAYTLGTDKGVMIMGFAGTQSVNSNDAAALACDTDGALHIADGGNSITIDGTVTADAGTGTFTVDLGANNDVQGDIAHDAADSGNPLKIGAKVETSLSGITLAADGDRTDLYAGADGVLITRPHCNLEDIVTGNASDTGGSSTSLIAAQGAGVKTYLLAFTITNTSATDTYCEIKDGATAKYTVPVPANGGVTVNLPAPIPGTANTAWNFDMGAAVTTAYASAVGFKSKV